MATQKPKSTNTKLKNVLANSTFSTKDKKVISKKKWNETDAGIDGAKKAINSLNEKINSSDDKDQKTKKMLKKYLAAANKKQLTLEIKKLIEKSTQKNLEAIQEANKQAEEEFASEDPKKKKQKLERQQEPTTGAPSTSPQPTSALRVESEQKSRANLLAK